MRGRLLAGLLTWAACVAAAAAGPCELRLRSGDVMRAKDARLVGRTWRIELPSGIALTLPQDKVLSVRELGADETLRPRRISGLNTPGAEQPGESVAAAPLSATSLDDQALLSRVGGLQAERRFREAEALLRAELVDRPGDALRLVLLGRVLVEADRFQDALEPLRLAGSLGTGDLRRARDLSLAEAYSRLDRLPEALRVLESTPEDGRGSVAAARERLARDQEANSDLDHLETRRFSLHLPAGGARLDTRPLLDHLDAAWDELAAALGGEPQERVVVVIHPGDGFWETTGMGSSVGGLYDGKVRVPAGSLDPPSPRLGAVLRHELAHAFVDALTGGRADRVWQEGIAEHFEGSDLNVALERRLASAHRQGAWPPEYDHATAHSRLEWFLGRWGMPGLRDLLNEWARRGSLDAALQVVCGLGSSELETAWALGLERKWER